MAMTDDVLTLARRAISGTGATTSNPLYIPKTTVQTPVYVPPTKEEFSWDVEDSRKPTGTENWTWSKSIDAKKLWDDEQAQNEESAYKQYLADLEGYKNVVSADAAKQEQLNKYFADLGEVAPVVGDPTAAIRQLGNMYKSTTDPSLQAQYHQQALDLAKQVGWINDGYTGSVNGLSNMTLAGTPTYEKTYNDTKYADAKAQQDWENDYKERTLAADTNYKNASLANRGSSGTGVSGTATNAAIASIYDYDSAESAMSALSQYATTMVNQGVDISKVQAAMKARWPNYFKDE